MIDDLQTFIPVLRSWLDEDERVAKAAGGAAWWSPPDRPHEVHDGAGGSSFTVPFLGYDDHIGRFHPARVLDEVAAKRRLIDAYEEAQRRLGAVSLEPGATNVSSYVGQVAALGQAVRIIATGYRNWAGRTPDGKLAR